MSEAREDRLIRPSGRACRPGPLICGSGGGKCPDEVRGERSGGNFAAPGLRRELLREFAADRRQGRARDVGVGTGPHHFQDHPPRLSDRRADVASGVGEVAPPPHDRFRERRHQRGKKSGRQNTPNREERIWRLKRFDNGKHSDHSSRRPFRKLPTRRSDAVTRLAAVTMSPVRADTRLRGG